MPTSQGPFLLSRGRTRSRHFLDQINKIIKCPTDNECGEAVYQCAYFDKAGKKVELRPMFREHIEKDMVHRAEYMLWYETTLSEKKSRRGTKTTWDRMDGFLLSYVTAKKDVPKIYYIDLLCSRHRKGRALLRAAEVHAAQLGCRFMALRAADEGLIPYYRSNGYYRVFNDCSRTRRRTQADKVNLALMDKDTDLDGFWMSKCLYKQNLPRGVELRKPLRLSRGVDEGHAAEARQRA